MRVAMMVLGLLALSGTAPASAHGCHDGWQQGRVDGWHSHGAHCATRKGIGISRRGKAANRRAV